jgi:hypothetical protein
VSVRITRLLPSIASRRVMPMIAGLSVVCDIDAIGFDHQLPYDFAHLLFEVR